eukprot:4340003-Pyramimonas_sp.AAC.1
MGDSSERKPSLFPGALVQIGSPIPVEASGCCYSGDTQLDSCPRRESRLAQTFRGTRKPTRKRRA